MMVVAVKKRFLVTAGGRLRKDSVETLRSRVVLSEEMVQKTNERTQYNGVHYEIDRKETEKYHKVKEKRMKEIQEKKQLDSAGAKETLGSLLNKALEGSQVAKTVKKGGNND